MNDDQQLLAERVGDDDAWTLTVTGPETDSEDGESEDRLYALYATPVRNGYWTTQITLAAVELGSGEGDEDIEFSDEIYTVFAYSSPEREDGINEILCGMLQILQVHNVDNPVDLVHRYGGHVRGRSVNRFAAPDTH